MRIWRPRRSSVACVITKVFCCRCGLRKGLVQGRAERNALAAWVVGQAVGTRARISDLAGMLMQRILLHLGLSLGSCMPVSSAYL